MTFLIHRPTEFLPADPYTRALDEWRRTARLVSELWDEYSEVGRDFRPIAFAAYTAALDAEEAAANELFALAFALPEAA